MLSSLPHPLLAEPRRVLAYALTTALWSLLDIHGAGASVPDAIEDLSSMVDPVIAATAPLIHGSTAAAAPTMTAAEGAARRLALSLSGTWVPVPMLAMVAGGTLAILRRMSR